MRPSITEPIAFLLCLPLGALIGLGVLKWRNYRKEQELRALVGALMAEHKEARKKLVECPKCFYGKTWRPEVLAGSFPINYDDPLLEDCQSCAGEGFVPRIHLV